MPNLTKKIYSYFVLWSSQGTENIRNEIQDPTEPLIDPVHGHGR